MPPKHPRTISVRMNVGGFKLVPLPPLPDSPDTPRTEVTVLVSIDATAFVVPDSIISFILKVFAPLVHKNVLAVFRRMFHQAGGSAVAAVAARQASSSAPPSRSAPSVATCSGSMLLERLALRPEYAGLDAHVAQVLAAQRPQGDGITAAGPTQPLDLTTPRTTGAGLAV